MLQARLRRSCGSSISFVRGLLKLLALNPEADAHAQLTQEELRSLVLEGTYFRGKHRAMLANLFDLDSVSVDDVMTPRSQIEAIDLTAKPSSARAAAREQLSHAASGLRGRARQHRRDHSREAGPAAAAGRRARCRAAAHDSAAAVLRSGRNAAARAVAAVPGRAPAPRSRRRRIRRAARPGDRSRTSSRRSSASSRRRRPEAPRSFQREADGSVVVDGMASLRVLNRKLGTDFPLDGPEDAQWPDRRATWRNPRRRRKASGSPAKRSKSCRFRTAR